MINRTLFIPTISAILSWGIGYYGTLLIFQGLLAVSNYAYIVGWWLTAYISLFFNVPVATAIPLYVGYFVIFLLATTNDQSWFYRDSITILPAIWIGLIKAFFYCSPILFNWLFQKVVRSIRASNRKTRQ